VGHASRRDSKHIPQLGLSHQKADLQRIPLRAGRMKNGNRPPEVVDGTPPYTVHRPHLQMVRDVRNGLTSSPKQLSPKYFYDERGSELFEAITELPEYYPTRTEAAIFASRGAAIADAVGSGMTLIDLGAGNCANLAKTAGKPCTASAQCMSGFCIDGVCCNTPTNWLGTQSSIFPKRTTAL
jgi:hypothetical protein